MSSDFNATLESTLSSYIKVHNILKNEGKNVIMCSKVEHSSRLSLLKTHKRFEEVI